MEEEKRIYRLNDDISFRKCFLSAGEKLNFGDCTDFSENEHDWRTYYSCNNKGIHLCPPLTIFLGSPKFTAFAEVAV